MACEKLNIKMINFIAHQFAALTLESSHIKVMLGLEINITKVKSRKQRLLEDRMKRM